MKVFLDTYSGTGGASEAALQSDEWRVLRVDNDPQFKKVPHTHISDASWIVNLRAVEQIEVAWFSFPCTEYARTSMPWTRAKLPEGFTPDTTEAIRTRDFIKWLEPRFYCIENVRVSIPFLIPIFGPPSQVIGPYVLWHNLPDIIMPPGWEPLRKEDLSGAVVRGHIPIELSQAVLEAAETPTLGEWQ